MPDRPTIVRPIDTPRLNAAGRGVSTKMGEVLNHANADWNPQLLAGLYAAAALEADDAHAAERGLITQHHGIARGDLTAALDLAQQALDGQHAAPGKLHPRCPSCEAALALGRVRNAVDWTAGTPRRGTG